MKSFSFGLIALLLDCVGLTACTSQPTASVAVRIRWSSDPQTLDPLTASTAQALETINLLHCSLLYGDYESQRYVPWLAETLPVVSRRDSLTLLTYTLRSEATWDNGQPVLARDVAFTLKVLNCPGLPTEYMRAQYGFVLDIELSASNARQFTLVCQSASQNVIGSSGDYLILPEYSLDPQGTLRTVPLPLLRTDTTAAVRRYPALSAFARRYRASRPEQLPGCGPYTLTAWEKNRYLRLRRKPDWWARTIPNPPRWLKAQAAYLDYRIIPDKTTALLALRRGDIDLYAMPPAQEFNRLRHAADTAKLVFRTADSYDMTMAGFNTQQPVLRNPITRRALSMLFDVPGLMLATQQGLAYPSVGPINPHDKLAYNDSLPLLPFSPKAAELLLPKAGWQQRPDGTWWQGKQQLALRLLYEAGDASHETIALQLQTAAKRIGIPITIQAISPELLREDLLQGNMDVYVRTGHGNPFSYNLLPILHSKGIKFYNYTHFQNLENDRLIEAIMTEPDPQRQARLLRRFQALLQEQSPMVVLYFARHRLIASRRLSPLQAISIRPGYDALQVKLASAPSQ